MKTWFSLPFTTNGAGNSWHAKKVVSNDILPWQHVR